MAVAAVLNTTELLESILIKLPFERILQVKAVSRQWKKLIENSVQIKRVLFLAPDGTPIHPASAKEGSDKWPKLVTPMLETDPIKTLPRFEEHAEDDPLTPYEIPRPWQHSFEADGVATKHHLWWNYEHLDLKTGIKLPQAYRAMYLTQPPITACKLDLGMFDFTIEDTIDTIIYDPQGITLGLIADVAVKLIRQCEQYDSERFRQWRERRCWHDEGVDIPAAATWRVLTEDAKTRDTRELLAELNAALF